MSSSSATAMCQQRVVDNLNFGINKSWYGQKEVSQALSCFKKQQILDGEGYALVSQIEQSLNLETTSSDSKFHSNERNPTELLAHQAVSAEYHQAVKLIDELDKTVHLKNARKELSKKFIFSPSRKFSLHRSTAHCTEIRLAFALTPLFLSAGFIETAEKPGYFGDGKSKSLFLTKSSKQQEQHASSSHFSSEKSPSTHTASSSTSPNLSPISNSSSTSQTAKGSTTARTTFEPSEFEFDFFFKVVSSVSIRSPKQSSQTLIPADTESSSPVVAEPNNNNSNPSIPDSTATAASSTSLTFDPGSGSSSPNVGETNGKNNGNNAAAAVSLTSSNNTNFTSPTSAHQQINNNINRISSSTENNNNREYVIFELTNNKHASECAKKNVCGNKLMQLECRLAFYKCYSILRDRECKTTTAAATAAADTSTTRSCLLCGIAAPEVDGKFFKNLPIFDLCKNVKELDNQGKFYVSNVCTTDIHERVDELGTKLSGQISGLKNDMKEMKNDMIIMDERIAREAIQMEWNMEIIAEKMKMGNEGMYVKMDKRFAAIEELIKSNKCFCCC